MRHKLRLFVLFWIVLLSAWTAGEERPLDSVLHQDLDVGVRVLGNTYCRNYGNNYTVYFRMRLVFTNRSGHPVILSNKPPFIPKVRLSESLDDARKGRFVYDPDPYMVSKEPPVIPSFGRRPNPSMFELLDPHKQFISPETRTGILAVRDSAALHGPESGKKYVMQVYVWTWPFMMKTEAIDDLERRWERWGKLETGTVKSDFFDIVVPHLQNPAQCEPDR